MSLEIAAARPSDLPAIRQLLATVDLPDQGVDEHLENFFVSYNGSELAGVGGLEVHAPSGLVRSVAVHPDRRRRGLARALWTAIEGRAQELRLDDLYLLTLTAESYFSRLGFAPVPRDQAPDEIRRTTEFRERCPDSAVLMSRTTSV